MSTRDEFVRLFPALDNDPRGEELLSLFRSTSPISATGPSPASVDDLLRIYDVRAKHLAKHAKDHPTEHAASVLSDVRRLCTALESYQGGEAHIWIFGFEPNLSYMVFVFSNREPVAICVRTADRLRTDPADWARMWGLPQ